MTITISNLSLDNPRRLSHNVMMSMVLLNQRVLTKAGKKHRDAFKPLQLWAAVAAAASWKSIDDVRTVYPSADGVPIKVKGIGTIVATVFNIKGNEYRLITLTDFDGGTITCKEFLTHAEYSKDAWKGRLP